MPARKLKRGIFDHKRRIGEERKPTRYSKIRSLQGHTTTRKRERGTVPGKRDVRSY